MGFQGLWVLAHFMSSLRCNWKGFWRTYKIILMILGRSSYTHRSLFMIRANLKVLYHKKTPEIVMEIVTFGRDKSKTLYYREKCLQHSFNSSWIMMEFIVTMHHDKSYIISQIRTINLETETTVSVNMMLNTPENPARNQNNILGDVPKVCITLCGNNCKFLWYMGLCLPTYPSINYPHCCDHRNNLTLENSTASTM